MFSFRAAKVNSHDIHHFSQANVSVEGTHERNLDITSRVIISAVALEYFIKAFEKKGPPVVNWTKIKDLFKDMSNPVVIGFDIIGM